ncbi:MAG: glycosyltransferase family 2 protein [Deltaproteobacteria bacterium]|nr:glycosyltransferase family 2 protein [Deltaproteobacteria bacterium]
MNNKCIIIPAYNEEKNISSVIAGIRKYSEDDIIVVDDGSDDFTGAVAQNAGAFVIRHPFNLGYGVALQTGYKYAAEKHYDFVLQMDGDGQHKPEFIPALFREVESGDCDIVIGSRFLGESRYKSGLLKSLGIKLFRLTIRLVTGEKITDPTSGYQCLHRKVFEYFTGDYFPSDYPDANVIIMLHRAGFRIREIPVEMLPNPEARVMHHGVFTISFYLFKVFLSIFITLIRKKQ